MRVSRSALWLLSAAALLVWPEAEAQAIRNQVRNRVNLVPSGIAFTLLPGIASTDLCQGTLEGGAGETLTLTRASSAYCNDGDGLVLLSDNEPRVEATGLKVEGAATNLILQSETLGTTWTEGSVTVTDDTTVAPNGTTTADTITVDSDGATRSLSQPFTATAARHTLSCWALATETATSASVGILQSTFVAQTGTILHGPGSISGTNLQEIADLSTTEATRFAITTDGALSAATARVFVYPDNSLTQVAGDAVVFWGCQVEAGTRATSYIPTVGTQETRPLDAASVAQPAALTDTAGCVALTVTADAVAASSRILGFGATNYLGFASTTTVNLHDGTNTVTATLGSSAVGRSVRLVATWTGTTMTVTEVGETEASGTYDETLLDDPIYFMADSGGTNLTPGTISDVVFGASPEACR